jgi:hypothetical protein
MKFGTMGLCGMALAVAFASGAWAAPSEREAAPPTGELLGGRQFAKGSPASKAFGNPFKTPSSETLLDFEPTGSIPGSGKTQPSADGKPDAASPSVTAPAVKKKH